jgi:hypothetical protein
MNLKIRLSAAIEEWMMKEEGSFEDSKRDSTHVYAILGRLRNGNNTLSEREVDILIKSGTYHATAWNDDEIDGGARTKATIQRIVNKLKP